MGFDSPDAAIFYVWWLLINGLIYFSEFYFLLRFAKQKTQKHDNLFSVIYVAVNCGVTYLVIHLQVPGFLSEIIHIVFFILFAVAILRRKVIESVVALAVVFTLSAFRLGIFNLLMRFLIDKITVPAVGNVIQAALSLGTVILFFLALRLIAKWYQYTDQKMLSILILPCGFMSWVIGLGLNSSVLSEGTLPLAPVPFLWALISLGGAIATFIVVLYILKKNMILGRRETERAVLESQLREQRIYLDEAQKRGSRLRSFHHDINNHLLVLSGLIKEKKYTQVENYLEKFHKASSKLFTPVVSGNEVLDVLLKEKINYAEQNHIPVDCVMGLPKDIPVDDLDLCIIFSNALDNAIQACLRGNLDQRGIFITGRMRHDFLLIEVTNYGDFSAPIKLGTGLTNIKYTVEKYGGTMNIQQNDQFFRLSLFVCCGENER